MTAGRRRPVHAVETIQLGKRYGRTEALRSLDFTVDQGEIMVLLGPNGSGKTTLLMILATVLKPTRGTARVMSFDVVTQPTRVRESLGICFQEARGFWRHKPAEILMFHAAIYGVEKSRRRAAVEEVLRDLELWDSRNKMFMHLSGGQAKRLETAKVLLQKPRFAIFDEPTSQVDLRGKRLMWDRIKALCEKGSTVLVATNEVREAEYLADRVTILHGGERIVTDTVRTLKDSIAGGDVVEIELDAPAAGAMQNELAHIEGTVKTSVVAPNRLRVEVSRAEAWVPEMIGVSARLQARVTSVRITEPSLDDVFLHFTGRALEVAPIE